MPLLAAGRVAGCPAGAARPTRSTGLAIGFFRRRTTGTAGESTLRHFRWRAFRGSVSHLRWLIGVDIGIFSKCSQKATQDKYCRKHYCKKSFHSEPLHVFSARW